MRQSYGSKEEIVARMDEVLKGIAVLEANKSRTPKEENLYQELSLELTTLDTNLKARDGITI